MKCPTCGGSGEIDARSASFGSVIKERRKQLGMSQGDLAKKINVTRACVANIESNRQRIVLENIRPIASPLNIPPEDLLP